MSETRRVAFCPSCCNVAPQVLEYQLYYSSWGLSYDNDEKDEIPAACFVAVCDTCHSAVIYTAEGAVPESKDFVDADLTYPAPDDLDNSVPKVIRQMYKEAVRIKWLSSSAFAGQIRRCLEAVCEDRSASGRNLSSMLKDLAKKGELPPVLAEMTDVIRLLGNQGVHAGSERVRPAHVNSINDFFKAVIEYIYIAPAKVSHLKGILKGVRTIKFPNLE